MKTHEFTKEEIGDAGRGNAEGLWLTTIAYFISKGSGLDDWLDFVGTQYAPGWVIFKDQGALAVCHHAVLNWLSCGATVVSCDGDDSRAEAIMEFPTNDLFTTLGIQHSQAHRINQIFVPIAKQAGLHFTWESAGTNFKITFKK